MLAFVLSVPIIPEFIYDMRHPDAPLSSFPKNPPPMPVTTPNNDLDGSDSTTIGYGKDFKIPSKFNQF